MSSDTDTSASTSPQKYKKHKKSKKLKRKTDKKKHKNKEKKRHRDKKRDSQKKHHVEAEAILAKHGNESTEVAQINDAFGPALPPHLLKDALNINKTLIGPELPRELLHTTEGSMKSTEPCEPNDKDNDREVDATDFCYGPMPVSVDAEGMVKMSATQIELEQRALELKLAAIEGTGQTTDAKVREEWMLELPAVGLKGGLAALSNMKRTFHQGKERPDFSDRSSWTKTPQDAENPTPCTSKGTTSAEALKRSAEAAYERQRDEEQEQLAKKHKKKHKRDESLVDIHQRKLRKEQKKREKELAAAGAKPERRPFSRDVDLKLNKIDSNQTKQIVDKAKILNTKFSSGKTKYL
ncbi:GPALPP motifs-containing protein 1 [Rhagoletis pomonella]|uniref:GPALPP motifs-containing protein 1 n=1 Tax=Rhagoletis pomonella TaxID=28610 RepID=UPI0017849572|nr:GPALPP motifs-containing protein 1 [Rhagoletis pomonella]XP_036324556.1 GPALPP motifs-containing protein 1 [Rhagoletis pomonella]XP_036324557.1 GPALPP motifs-containing protein 1 [Rhagoletis pomonella]